MLFNNYIRVYDRNQAGGPWTRFVNVIMDEFRTHYYGELGDLRSVAEYNLSWEAYIKDTYGAIIVHDETVKDLWTTIFMDEDVVLLLLLRT